jgi:hypothetical protein
MFKQQLAEIDNMDNPMYSTEMVKMLQQGYEMQIQEYNSRLAQWEKDYPENNPNLLVKGWLNKFLSESSDVDFNAGLQQGQYGKKIFAKPEYEAKSYMWKLCYRAGKETAEALRAYANNWLKELN